jgi:hypothetical protein
MQESGRTLLVTMPWHQEYAGSLSSVHGRTVLKLAGHGSVARIAAQGLTSGMYVVSLRGTAGTFAQRVFIGK